MRKAVRRNCKIDRNPYSCFLIEVIYQNIYLTCAPLSNLNQIVHLKTSDADRVKYTINSEFDVFHSKLFQKPRINGLEIVGK